MEENINIAEIFENKSQGTKLYSLTYGDCFYQEYTGDFGIECQSQNGVQFNLDEYGRYCIEGECILFPSKEMRDWAKFSWKKGDILVNSSGFKLFFDRWANDDYTRFFGKVNILEDSFIYETEKYTLVSKDETLDNFGIDKPEFNDGDVIKITWYKYSAILIFWEYSNFGKGFDSHVFFNIKTKIIEYNIHGHTFKDAILRLATEEEKKQLFSALEKKGKRWDSDKKAIVDLKSKVELKPFDKVLCRNSKDDTWEADFFARLTRKEIDYTQSGKYLCVGDLWMYCIPYNEETAHLLGTTDEWKGGEV